MILKDRRILITSGPTWVPIDSVRVISNIATGETGLLLAQKLARLGAKVTLLTSQGETCCLDKRIRVLRFRYFDELQRAVSKELKSITYDIVIHSAAVSDYRPAQTIKQKLSSNKKIWKLNLMPTPKIIEQIKKLRKDTFLVGFKFIPQVKFNALLKASRHLIERADADLVVANTISKKKYQAYLVDKETSIGPMLSKNSLAKSLTLQLTKTWRKN